MTEFSPRIELIMAAFQAVACHPEGWMPRLEKARRGYAAWRGGDLLPSEQALLADLDPLIPAIDGVLAAAPASLRLARRELETALLTAAKIFPKDSGAVRARRPHARGNRPPAPQHELQLLRDPSSGETTIVAAAGAREARHG